MKFLAEPFLWIGTTLLVLFGTWVKSFFGQFLPSPQQVRLAIYNACKTRSPRPEQRFRLVLCWLDNDRSGRDTGTVAEAFTGVEGIELVRFHRVVSAPGAADDWRPAMRKGALAVLKNRNADLAVVGTVKDAGKVLSLWFVPREGDGTLRRGHHLPYELVKVTLQDDFHDDLRAQLTAEALRVAAPLAGTEMRGRVLEKGLNGVTEKIAALLEGGAVESKRRASLHMALGGALATLGMRESGTERLEQAVAAYTEALKERTRERVPLDWAATQNNLGNALVRLGERESGTERLEQAVAAFTEALKERTRERAPLHWAGMQNNLGNALATLGKRESGTERLEQAVAACTEALKECTRERAPLHWAAMQNNLGAALVALGKRESGTERLEQAVAACTEALKECTRERAPLAWAATQNNLGNALATLGKRESGTERLEQAVAAYTEALKECTRERVPLDWAGMQNNLGNALGRLGERESGTERLEQAVAAYTEALKECTRERVPLDWAGMQNNLGNLGAWASGRAGQSALSRHRGAQGVHPRACAPPLGCDAEQPRQRPCDPG